MLLGADRTLDDCRVVDVRDERDDEVDLFELRVEGCGVIHIERDCVGVLEAFAELLGGFDGAAGFVCPSALWSLYCIYISLSPTP